MKLFSRKKVQSRAKKKGRTFSETLIHMDQEQRGGSKTKTEIKETRRQKKRKEDNNKKRTTLTLPSVSLINQRRIFPSVHATHLSPLLFMGRNVDKIFSLVHTASCFALHRHATGEGGEISISCSAINFSPPSSLGFKSKRGMHISN